jgi:uncharacterized delta-60 repeat protein
MRLRSGRGSWWLLVGLVAGCGGDDVAAPAPDAAVPATLTVAAVPTRVIVGQGETADVAVSVTRDHTTAPVIVALSTLPTGLTASPIILLDGVDSGRITVAAAPGAMRLTTDVDVVATSASASASAPLSIVVSSTDGLLDPTFGTGGMVTTAFGGADASLGDVTVQSDGGIVVTGTIGARGARDVVVARFHPDGSLDSSFGTGGTVVWDLGQDDAPNGVAVLPGGRLIVTATSLNPPAFDNVYAHARLLATDGTVVTTDPSFGAQGTLAGPAPASRVVVQAAVAAFSLGNQLYRYAPAETLPIFDTSLGSIYPVVLAAPGATTLHVAMASSAATLQAARFTAIDNSNGGFQLDTSFGTSGVLELGTTGGSYPTAVVIRGGRAIVSARNGAAADTDFTLSGFDAATGVVATGFGTAGRVAIDFAQGPDRAEAMIGTSDGLIAAGVATIAGHGTDLALVRLYDSGDIDHEFGIDGVVTTDVAGADDGITALARDPVGRLVAVGFTTSQGHTAAVGARYRVAP